MKRIILTGGAGFIGSCMLRTLNDNGIEDVIVVDSIGNTEKWRNLVNKKYTEYIHKDLFLERLIRGEFSDVDAVIHLGACSSTTERDFDYLWMNNVEYSKKLWKFCSKMNIPFIYASSAATYGDGTNGFDDKVEIDCLRPLNGYGYSKHAFDLWTENQECKPPQFVGLKFFNVYGPNEYCKGSMASMFYHGYNQISSEGKIRLFKSYRLDCDDGYQERDFVYVKDVCSVMMFFLKHPEYSGIFNVGTGRAQTFIDLARAVGDAAKKKVEIEFIDMPSDIKEKYQYHTQADITKLRNVGYTKEFMDVEKGAKDYVLGYLSKGYAVY